MKTEEEWAKEIHRKCVEMDWSDDEFCVETVKAIQSDAIESTIQKCASICLSHNNSGEGSECRKAILSLIPQKEKKV